MLGENGRGLRVVFAGARRALSVCLENVRCLQQKDERENRWQEVQNDLKFRREVERDSDDVDEEEGNHDVHNAAKNLLRRSLSDEFHPLSTLRPTKRRLNFSRGNLYITPEGVLPS